MSKLENYRLGRTLGGGTFATVRLAEHILTGFRVAMKILDKRQIKFQKMLDKVRREIKILKRFHHSHIMRLYESFESKDSIYLVMEYVPSGELYNLIERRGRLPESEARKYFQQIISAIDYSHDHGVAHRDIKPENILLDNDKNIKVGDFGLSNYMRDGEFFKTSCGSPNYAAPEVISGLTYCGPDVDVWSCGVVLYALLAGYLPFDENNISALFAKIKSASYQIPSQFSDDSKDLIQRMLNPDPIARITIKQIKQHPWYLINVPLHLQISETTVDKNQVSIMQYNTNKIAVDIDEETLSTVLQMPSFAQLEDNMDIRNQIILGTDEDFVICYELMLNEKLKKNRIRMTETQLPKPTFKLQDLTSMARCFQPQPSSDGQDSNMAIETPSKPSDWRYGFRVDIGPQELSAMLCKTF